MAFTVSAMADVTYPTTSAGDFYASKSVGVGGMVCRSLFSKYQVDVMFSSVDGTPAKTARLMVIQNASAPVLYSYADASDFTSDSSFSIEGKTEDGKDVSYSFDGNKVKVTFVDGESVITKKFHCSDL